MIEWDAPANPYGMMGMGMAAPGLPAGFPVAMPIVPAPIPMPPVVPPPPVNYGQVVAPKNSKRRSPRKKASPMKKHNDEDISEEADIQAPSSRSKGKRKREETPLDAED